MNYFTLMTIFINIAMPKQMIINMKKDYPFGQCAEGDDQTVKVLVRRQLPWGNDPDSLLQRAQFFRRLNQACIIHLEQILEEEEGLNLLYQYVPIRMQTWISNINQKFIESFCRQLIQLGQYLAKCYIDVNLTLENVGMDQNYRPKYFLDLDFELNQTLDKTVLKNNYHQQILNLFTPYVQHKIVPKPVRHRQPIDYKSELSPSKALALRQPKGDNYSTSSTLRLKQKAVALQKERKNQSISVVSAQWDMYPNEKSRKQSILSSVSNVKINRLGRRMEAIKSRLRHMYSPDQTNIRLEQRSIEKNPNSIAFNWDSTQKIYTNSIGSQQAIQPKMFCQNIMRDLQQEETIFQKFQKNLAKQLTKALPMKKNQTLKAKEYEQMKKSDDQYFKDFFQVLEDKPKGGQLALQPPKQAALTYEPLPTNREGHRMLSYYEQEEKVKAEKPDISQLENRVKSAINKSKKLINKFKGDR